ncbi:lipocalin-like domain-containing protein [Nocardia aurantia]|uniref:Lipocalin-like domain-containing protein n=1 Tax=Nocardia aurantia TaxID=2585199 RepID=A0A7K0DK47_9NOCA|nr:lipocalin-like domain-containing protein [Nocardia aurantia]MQY26079.1 hypothetical protein [Nocardia aurantia]
MDVEELVGRWNLTAWTATDENGTVSAPFGDNPQGCVIYTPGGWMSGQLAVADRRQLPTPVVFAGTESERAEAYSSYLAYCGEYRLEAGEVVHTLHMSLFPNWVGGEQRRTAELSGDRLVLATPPTPMGGRVLVNRLYWIRAE